MSFDAVLLEAEPGVKAARRDVLADHHELDQLDLASRMFDYRVDELPPEPGLSCAGADVHTPQHALVRFLGALLRIEAGGAEQFHAAKCAEHGGGGQPI